jgi:hypothetical protein
MRATQKEIRQIFLAGFMASGEGFNGEYPYETEAEIEADEWFQSKRDAYLASVR